ncbi:hypothetical protein F4777DRAFT_539260 [Nemania sp. FL0916]|nr:hypothetical protein F4777DRAFT_539260 [Nemania sp. FL0916]
MADVDFYSLPFDQQVEIFDATPLLEAPHGVVPNYEHPHARNEITIAVTVIGLAFTTVIYTLRMYSRLVIIKNMRKEDYVGMAGFVTYVALCGVLGALVHTGGFLAHQWELLGARSIEIAKLIQAQTTLYNFCMMFTKVAILLEWSHLFVPYPDRNVFWWTCHVLIWVNIALYSSVTVVQHTKCLPYNKNWYSFVPGHCLNTKIVDTFVPTFNFFIDLIILIFPQKTIWKLQVSRERRLAISAIFSSGILSIAFAGARVSVSIRTLTEPDFLWLGSQSVLFGLAEMTFAFWVFCVPAIPKSIHASRITALPRYLWSKMRSTASLAKKSSKESENSWPVSDDGSEGHMNSSRGPQKKQSKSSIFQQRRTEPSAANRILRTTDLLASVGSTHENVNELGDR